MTDRQSVSVSRPWGRLSTFGLGFVALLAGQMAALMALTWWQAASIAQLPDLSGDGVAVTLVIFVSTPIQVLLLATFAQRGGGNAIGDLGLKLPSRGEVVFGIICVAALIVAGNIVSWLVGHNVVTSFQSDIYRTAGAAGWLPWIWLWLAVTVVAPIGEEILFRGFLLRGWLRASHEVWPVIVVTALLWAVIHVQYDWYVITQVFSFGLLLGWIRWASGSTILTILLHGLINFEGMVETFIGLQWLT